MIVTCPSCASKYRVRDEAVPPEGAELQCPSCSSLFIAHPPKIDSDGVVAALEKMTRARDGAELRVLELEQIVKDAEARAAAAEANVRRLTDELARHRMMAGDQAELLSVKQQLFDAQKRQKGLAADLEVANALVSSLQADVTVLRAGNSPAVQSEAAKQIAALQAELESLRAEQAMQEVPSSPVQSMMAAIGPMLWGLDKSITYLEQFAGNEPTLAGHVKQLRLLQKVLQKLSES